jgi:FkbM family methyltransferase
MPAVEHIKAIEGLDPKTLIDVGANKGQFAVLARYLFPSVEIHAFEPLEEEGQRFKTVVSGSRKLYRIAISSESGNKTFYVTSRADSSSLLKPSKAQADAYGVSLAQHKDVDTARLDDVIDLSKFPRPILLKMDVQGGELAVLRGMPRSIPFLDFVYSEASFIHLYEQQPLAGEIIRFLEDCGFKIRGVFNQSSTKFGPTQADFLFCRQQSI